MSTRPYNPKPVNLADVFFFVVLTVLLLLTVPAAVLLVLKLMGRETAVNDWLKDNLGISYQVALPGWAAVVLLLVPFLLVLLYFLKMRRQSLQVPSTFLWRKSVEDLHVNSLFQWLRKNLLLLLQLACILLLIFAVMTFRVFGSGGTHYILMIDSSASMTVKDVEPNRLEAAKEMALAEIARHADNDAGMVIEFNGNSSVLQGYTSDRDLLRNAVKKISSTGQPTRLEKALRQAESLANPPNSAEDAKVRPPDEDPARALAFVPPEGIKAEVHLYSDGCFAQIEAEAIGRFAAGNLNINYHRVGQSGAEVKNVGLVSFRAANDRVKAGKLNVAARVLNFHAAAVDVTVELRSRVWGKADFTLDDRPLTLVGRKITRGDADKGEPDRDEPGDGLAEFPLAAPAEGEVLELHVRLLNKDGKLPHHDDFPLDDQAWLLIGGVRKARVLVVTPGNEALDWFLLQESTKKIADVTYLKPGDADAREKYGRLLSDAAVDLVIFDRCTPQDMTKGEGNALPPANTFFIDRLPATIAARTEAEKKTQLERRTPKILNPSHRHPLMRGLTGLDEIVFTRAFRVELDADKDERLPSELPRLLETEKDGAVLFVLPRGAYRDVVLTAPLVTDDGKWASNWPAMVSFPLFMSNLLHTLGNARETPAEEDVQPGQVKLLKLRRDLADVKVIKPDGTEEKDDEKKPKYELASGEFSYIADQVGVYRARWDGGEQPFVVNLLDADESDIQAREAIVVGRQRLSTVQNPSATMDTWKWGVLLALLLLTVEWALYHRRFFN